MSYFQAYKKVLKVNLITFAIVLIVGFIANAVEERKGVDPA
jgi:preprotein translocase subunit Sss1